MAPPFNRIPRNASAAPINEHNRSSATYYRPMQQAQHRPMQQAQHRPMQQNQHRPMQQNQHPHIIHKMNWLNYFPPRQNGFQHNFPPGRHIPPHQYLFQNSSVSQQRLQLCQRHAFFLHMHRMNNSRGLAQGQHRRRLPPNSRHRRKRASRSDARSRQNFRQNPESAHNSTMRPDFALPVASSSRSIRKSRGRQRSAASSARFTEKWSVKQRLKSPTQIGSSSGVPSSSRFTKKSTAKQSPGSPTQTGPSSRSAPNCTSTPRARPAAEERIKSAELCGRRIPNSKSTKIRSKIFGPSVSSAPKNSTTAPEPVAPCVSTSPSVRPTNSKSGPEAESDLKNRSKSADLSIAASESRSANNSAATLRIGSATEDVKTPEKSTAKPQAESGVDIKSKSPDPHATAPGAKTNSVNLPAPTSTAGDFRIIEMSPEVPKTVEFTYKLKGSDVSNYAEPWESFSTQPYARSLEIPRDESDPEIVVLPATQEFLLQTNRRVTEAQREIDARSGGNVAASRKIVPEFAHVIFYFPDEIQDPEPEIIPEGINIPEYLRVEEEEDPVIRRAIPIISRIRKLRQLIRPQQLKNTWLTSIRNSRLYSDEPTTSARSNRDRNFRPRVQQFYTHVWPRPACENCEYVFIGPNRTVVPTRFYASIPWKYTSEATKVLMEFFFDDKNLVIQWLNGEHPLDSGTIDDITEHVAYRCAVRKADVRAAIAKLCAEKTLKHYNS